MISAIMSRLTRHTPLVLVSFVLLVVPVSARGALRAGAYAQDITPTQFPVIVNGGFTEVIATKANDAPHARAIVMDNGEGTPKLAIVVVDSCMLPRELLDDAKARARKLTGIPVERMLISATHSHSAPSGMGCLGSDADASYVKILPDLLAKAIEQANRRIAPARIGFAVVNDPDHTACRRWVFRPDRMRNDPFGELTVRANMHPGYQSPDAIGPTGPIDPGLSIVSLRHADGRPLAVLANYSMHYVGTTPLSADYYGRFADRIATLLGADRDFVGVMSQGTSGDMWLADYAKPQPATRPTIDTFAEALARETAGAIKSMRYTDDASIVMRETTLTLDRRAPDEKRLAWARQRLAALGDKKPTAQPDIYAREAVFLHDEPRRELKLQAVRIGDVAIAAIPCEVYALTGLKIKGMSPLANTFTMSLANGSEGYIPPPEQHKLGGYTTWPARTAALEPQAEPKIVDTALTLLEELAGQKRRTVVDGTGPYAKAVLASKPAAYWRMDEFAGPICRDVSGNGLHGVFEDGVLFHLPGAPAGAITGDEGRPSSAAHFAGGRLKIAPQALEQNYSVEFLFWNGLANEARPVTAYLVSRGPDGDKDAPGDHLGIGGTYAGAADAGRLIFYNGNVRGQLLAGGTVVAPRTWHHVALAREGKTVRAWLDGTLEIDGEADVTSTAATLFFGGRCDGFANLEGKLDEIALYRRPLAQAEVTAHVQAAAVAKQAGAPAAETKAADPEAPTRTLPRSPEETLKSLHLPANLVAEVVAAEPLISSPVAIDFGPDGKLWVVEMLDYPYGMDGHGKPGGRVKYLESSKNDGHFDRATVFLDHLQMPNGILAWRDGVLITAAPDILYARDTDHDGKADKVDVLYTGFKTGNPQLRVNGLRPGLDNWIYVANGWSGGVVESRKTGQKLDIKGHDVHIRPETGEMELISGVSQFGREHDDAGRWFGTDNAHPLFHYTLDDADLRRNPAIAFPEPKNQLLPLPLPPVFPKSRFARRYIGLDHHGHFTSACGISVYRDELLFPASGAEALHAFICEPVHNLIQHQALTETADATFAAKREEGEPGADFVASDDNWFRPVMTRCGPDGAIWVVDMYRYMIEHPDWLNDVGKRELAPYYRDGAARGRIYRIYPKDATPRAWPRLEGRSAAELVGELESPSGYTRDRAQMMLLWNRDADAAAPALERMATTSASSHGRLHALCTLDGLHRLTANVLTHSLGDGDAAVRTHAVRLAAGFLTDAGVLKRVIDLADDPSPFVRVRVACTLGDSTDAGAAAGLAHLATAHPADATLAAAVASSLRNHGPAVTRALLARDDAMDTALFTYIVRAAASARGTSESLAPLIDYLVDGRRRDNPHALATLAGLLDVLASHGKPLSAAAKDPTLIPGYERIAGLLRDVRGIPAEVGRAIPLRIAATDLSGRLGETRDSDLKMVGQLLTSRTPLELQLSAIRAVGRMGDVKADGASSPSPSSPSSPASILLAGWADDSPAVRSAVADALLARESWALALAQSPAARDLDFSRRQRLLNHSSAKVKEAARATLAQAAGINADRQKVIDAYRPALELRGDAGHGREVFDQNCATCHRIGSAPTGHDIGPNLLTVHDWTKENMLTAILDPDRTVEPRYLAYTATLHDGSALTGLLTRESADHVTLKTLDDADHDLARAGLVSLKSTNHSLMPQGFESALSPQDLADVMAFVQGR